MQARRPGQWAAAAAYPWCGGVPPRGGEGTSRGEKAGPRTPFAPFVSVRAAKKNVGGNATSVGNPVAPAPANRQTPVPPPPTVVLNVGDEPVPIASCALAPAVDWRAYAAAVYRDDLLMRITGDPGARAALDLSAADWSAPYHLPCRVAAPPPPSPPEVSTAPTRRRRSR